MNIRKAAVLTTLLVCGFVSSVGAAIIVDTGPGPSHIGGYYLDDQQYIGAEFSLMNDTKITDIYGWISPVSLDGSTGHTGHIGIYTDGGDVPSTELYSDQFTVEKTLVNDWYGLNNLTWLLDAGSYWVTFEVRPGDTLDAFMPFPSISPLINTAHFKEFNGQWMPADDWDIGVRILGNPVPEPSTFLLLGGGLAGLAFYARRRRKE